MDKANQRRSGWLLAAIPILGIGVFLYFILGNSQKPTKDYGTFNFDSVVAVSDEPAAAQTPENYESRYEREWKKRMGDGSGAPTMLVPESHPAFKGADGDKDADKGMGRFKKGVVKSKKQMAREAREKGLIQKYGRVLDKENIRLRAIAKQYRKRYKIVKEVDLYFWSMPRFRELHRQYAKDKNPFKFFREAIKLPEVRKGVRKYITNPEVIKVGVMMASEGLRKRPPRPIFEESVRFITEDEEFSKYMMSEAWPVLMPRLPNALLTLPAGMDGSGVQDIAAALAAGAGTKIKYEDVENAPQ